MVQNPSTEGGQVVFGDPPATLGIPGLPHGSLQRCPWVAFSTHSPKTALKGHEAAGWSRFSGWLELSLQRGLSGARRL